MKLTELSQDTLDKIKSLRWDRILEKHEGPETWQSVLEWSEPELMMVDGRPVLLPVDRASHDQITILRAIWSDDSNSLTLFLKDTTYGDEWYASGFMAVCDRPAGENFYVAILYHEWFIIEQNPIFKS